MRNEDFYVDSYLLLLIWFFGRENIVTFLTYFES